MSLSRFSALVSVLLAGICMYLLSLPVFHYFPHCADCLFTPFDPAIPPKQYLTLAILTFSGLVTYVLLVAVMLWSVGRIVWQLPPMSLLDDDGTMLFCVEKGVVVFKKMMRRKDKELGASLSVGDLFREYISFPVFMEIGMPHPGAEIEITYGSTEVHKFSLKIEKLVLCLDREMGGDPHRLIHDYANGQEAYSRIREIVIDVLEETRKECIAWDQSFLFYKISVPDGGLKRLFLAKLSRGLRNCPYQLNNSDCVLTFSLVER